MNKKENNGISKVFTASEVGMLIEDLDSKMNLVLEGGEALDMKIDKNHAEFREFRQEVNDKFEVVFEELYGIRKEIKGKVDRDEFKAAFAME